LNEKGEENTSVCICLDYRSRKLPWEEASKIFNTDKEKLKMRKNMIINTQNSPAKKKNITGNTTRI